MMIGNRFRTFAIAFTAALTSRAAAIEPSQPTDLDPIAIERAAGTAKTEIELFRKPVENVKPYVEVRSKRIGGANYQVPMQVNRKRQQSLAFRWIISAARSEKGRPISKSLADEIYAAARGEGKAMTNREQIHRMAEANKAFAHFAR